MRSRRTRRQSPLRGMPRAASPITMIDHAGLVEEVRRRTGLDGAQRAEVAISAVLSVLRERLADDEVELLAPALPEAFARRLREGDYLWDFGLEVFYERVSARMAAEIGLAREASQVVGQVLAEVVPEETRERLWAHLPDDWRELLSPRAPSGPPPERERVTFEEHPRPRDTLATGRPGSMHPVSEARPEPAHAHSVARSSSPHAETKLSSSRGLTQERLRESLADASRPSGPVRPIARE